MRKLTTALATGALVFGLIAGAHAGAPVTTWEDPANDAGNSEQAAALPPATLAGLDLVKGTIAKSGKDVEFSVTHASMPPTGSAGEGFRLLWHINVDGEPLRFTVKSLDVGKPDAAAQAGTERVGQVYQGVARLEVCTETTTGITLVNCNATEYFGATFDAATATVTWKVPLASLKAKTGSLIAGGTHANGSSSCMICWVPQYAERSLTPTTVIDNAVQTVTYKVPKK
jgi:hypothetical protein